MLKISRSSRNKKLDKEKAGRIAVLAENQETLITAIEVHHIISMGSSVQAD